LKYLHENGCPWNEWTCAWAAKEGHLHALKWLHENGCPWNGKTCEWAVRSGQVEVFKYAFANGCACSENTLNNLRSKEAFVGVEEWMIEQRVRSVDAS
jgi:hypothetical protein